MQAAAATRDRRDANGGDPLTTGSTSSILTVPILSSMVTAPVTLLSGDGIFSRLEVAAGLI